MHFLLVLLPFLLLDLKCLDHRKFEDLAKDLARTKEEIKLCRQLVPTLPTIFGLLVDLLEVIDDCINVERSHGLLEMVLEYRVRNS